jgi:ribonuclease R
MQQADEEKRGRARADNVAIWEELGLHCSANERRADEASRDVEAWLKCYFMRDKLGEEYGGMVNGVTSFGIFVQLDSLFIEGLVHVTELGSDYFQYDEIKNELRGERTGIRYRLSDRVRVQVSRVDLDARKIDFRLVRDAPIKPHPVRGVAADKSSGENGGARVRVLPPVEGGAAAPGARRKKAAPAQSAAVKEAGDARGAAKKHGGAALKAASKQTARKKR